MMRSYPRAHCQANRESLVNVSYQDEHMKSILSIILCTQTIKYFIQKIGFSYNLEFLVERYNSDNGKRDNIVANQPTSEDRDRWLENLANELVEGLEVTIPAGTLAKGSVYEAKRSTAFGTRGRLGIKVRYQQKNFSTCIYTSIADTLTVASCP